MNKRFFTAWVSAFVAWMAGSFVVHGVLLHGDYTQLASMFRTDTDSAQYFPFMLLAHVVMSGAFVWIYARGSEPKAWMPQGLRFGLAVALLTAVPTYLIYYAVQPMPGLLVAKQMALDTAVTLGLGLLVGFLYRSQPAGE